MPSLDSPKHQQLIELYAAMAAHTAPECRACFIPYSCCHKLYCEHTIAHAKKKWGVDLPTTTDPKLPLMGPTGCTAAPHLRPHCTTHTCSVQSIGAKRGDQPWTDEYHRLSGLIDALEWELFPL
jgi:hypothetical protein